MIFVLQVKTITDKLFMHGPFRNRLFCLLFAKFFKIILKSRVLIMSLSIDSIAKLFSREIVDRKYVLISFSLEKLLTRCDCYGHC